MPSMNLSSSSQAPASEPTVNDILAVLAAEADEEHDSEIDAESALSAGAGIST